MRSLQHILPLAAAMLAAVASGRASSTTQPRVTLSDGPRRVGEKIELTITGIPETANPFNPAAVRIDAEITAPDGRMVSVPGFAQPRCEPRQINGETRYQPTGGLDWRVRWSAPTPGGYRGRVIVTVGNAALAESAPFRLRVEPADGPFHGFVCVSPTNRAAFAFTDGTAFIPVGENVCWQTPREKIFGWIAKLGANGAN